MPHLPGSDPAPGCLRGDAAFSCLCGHGRGCLYREPGGRRSTWAFLSDSWADMDRLRARRRGRRTGCREGRSQAAACLREREGRGRCGRRGSETDFPGSSRVNPPSLWLTGGEEWARVQLRSRPGGGRCAEGSGSVAHGCRGASGFQSQVTQRCEQNTE